MSAVIESGITAGSPAALERADAIYTATARGLALADALYLMTQTTIMQGGVHADVFRGAVEALAEVLEETLKKALEPCGDSLEEEQVKAGSRVTE